MRIISGAHRGRKLIQIQGKDIRPTSDRVREALFNIIGPGIRQMRVLDLFAGTGAFGIEALSRGARMAVFVEKAEASLGAIRQNIALCRLEGQCQVVCHDIISKPLPKQLFDPPFDLIFLDPPYNKGYAQTTLELEGFGDLLAPGGMVIVEQAHKEVLTSPVNGLDIYRQKKYSKTQISFLEKSVSS